MDTSHGGGEGGDRGVFAGEAGANTVSRAEHWICGAAGFVVTVAVTFALYPLLVAVMRPLYLLSSTALVVAFAVAWFATWALFELVWEWRAGRLRSPAD